MSEAVRELIYVAERAKEFIDKYRDTYDGDYGQAIPNEACELYSGLEWAMQRVEAELAQSHTDNTASERMVSEQAEETVGFR